MSSREPFPGAHAWRVFLECSWALTDILEAELMEARGMSIRWYDVLVHLEDAPEGLGMNEVAERILHSKSGLTRVIDNMEKAGFVRRERPAEDRRRVLVFITPGGRKALDAARVVHRDGIRRHFSEHLSRADRDELARVLEHVRTHVRPLRPGRVSGGPGR
ncbi:MAG: winged helix-turn-helix transcriptional regulator [Thermoleophilaceae bacterium]|nr:winged helix-turn-helix transcriptional regulator [Thermoleophilaceae bacterium]